MKKLLFRGMILLLLGLTTPHFTPVAAAPNPHLLQIAKNGRVLHAPTLKAIFWGTEWNDPAFSGDVISGLDSLLGGYSGSQYAFALTEYYDRTGAITPYTTYTGYVLDVSPAPPPGGLTSSVAIAKVCATTRNSPDPNGAYFVFSSTPKAPDAPGSACGFHAWGSCSNGKSLQVIGVPYTTGEIGSGCEGVQDTVTGHSLSLAQMANLAMHELAETITDPRNTGWHDAYGAEIGNKCIMTFPADAANYPVFQDGSAWKLQGLWSNAAFLAGTGAPNRNGQNACVW